MQTNSEPRRSPRIDSINQTRRSLLKLKISANDEQWRKRNVHCVQWADDGSARKKKRNKKKSETRLTARRASHCSRSRLKAFGAPVSHYTRRFLPVMEIRRALTTVRLQMEKPGRHLRARCDATRREAKRGDARRCTPDVIVCIAGAVSLLNSSQI